MSTETTTKELKIFEIHSGGEREWIAAYTNIEALKLSCHTSGMEISDFADNDEVKELPREKWKDYSVTDEYGVVVLTFEQWMAVNKSPDYIACTAY